MSDLNPEPLQQYQPPDYPDAQAFAAPKFRLHKFLMFLRRYWWVPTIAVTLTVGVSAYVVLHRSPTFVSRGSLWETVKLHLPEGALFSEDVVNFLGTQSDLLQSGLLRERALAMLRASTNSGVIPLDANGDPLLVKLRVAQAAKSAVLVIEATGAQPAYLRAYLEALMQSYLDYKGEIRREVSGETLASIIGQVQLAEQELKNQQDVLTDYQRTNNLAILQEEGTVAGGYLTRLKTELSDLELEDRLLAAETNLNLSGSATNAGQSPGALDTNSLVSPLAGTSGAVSPELQARINALESMKIQRDTLGTNMLETHPRMVQLNADISRTEKELDAYRRQNRELAASARESARGSTRLRIENIRGSIKEWEAQVVIANARIAESERLKINVQRAQLEYERLATLVQNVKISRNIDQETLAILEHASLSKRSYKTEITVLGLALAASLALGFGFVAWQTVRDEKFGSLLEVNERFGDAVIAQVPELKGLKGKLALTENVGESHMYAESYRCLRSALLFLPAEMQRPRLLLITSALPDEGKSTVAANLARTLALGGARVLLVDADLRRGDLHHLFGVAQEPGLAHLLTHPEDADQALQSNCTPNLSLISCGARLPNPGDLFLSAALDQLLARWRSQFDHVIIDSSPIFAADDATTLAPKVDGTLLVVRSRFSNARQVRNALELLQQRRARVLGVVFNRADASARAYDYYKYAKYYPTPDAPGAKTG